MSSGKWRPFCLDLNVLLHCVLYQQSNAEYQNKYRQTFSISRNKSQHLNVYRVAP